VFDGFPLFSMFINKESKPMDRRSLIKNAGIAGVLAAGVAPAVHAQETVRWRLATSFPKALETLHGCAVKFSETVKALSGGKFEVSVHAAGELVPAFGIVDALADDSIEMGETASYYYTGKDPSFAFSCAIPFGFTAQQNQAWKLHGNGHKLLDELFAKYNFHARSALNTGTQMGGWYRKEMNKPEDFKGLKMRLGGGVFGESMAKLGVVSQNMPGGDVYQALEKARSMPPSSSAPTTTRRWAGTRLPSTTTTAAGGKAVPTSSSSSTTRPTPSFRPNTRLSSIPRWTPRTTTARPSICT